MLIKPQSTIAFICPVCGGFQIKPFHLFSVSACKCTEIVCVCGESKARISYQQKRLAVSIPCIMCHEEHSYTYPIKGFFEKGIYPLYCKNSLNEIGFIGEEEEIKKAVWALEESYNEELADILDDSFANPDIMLAVIQYMERLAHSNQLHCACEKTKPELKVDTDTVELFCSQCEYTKTFSAATTKDLEKLKNLSQIHLMPKNHCTKDDFRRLIRLK